MEAAAPTELCLAIDIGGTKMAAGIVTADGSLSYSDRVRTPRANDAEALFKVLADLVSIVLTETDAAGSLAAVGIGCGGPISNGAVSPLNIPSWRSFPLSERVGELDVLAQTRVPVALDNDAKALALAEGWKGAARGLSNFVALVVSTGVGGGVVVDGRLLDGASGNAGHIGHLVVEPEGNPCACGARGCLEAEVSGPAIEKATGAPPSEAPREARQRAGRLTGRALAGAANLLDIGRFFVGGSVALGFGPEFFLAAQRELTERACLDFSRQAQVEPVGLGPDAPLIGAAALGFRALGREVLS